MQLELGVPKGDAAAANDESLKQLAMHGFDPDEVAADAVVCETLVVPPFDYISVMTLNFTNTTDGL